MKYSNLVFALVFLGIGIYVGIQEGFVAGLLYILFGITLTAASVIDDKKVRAKIKKEMRERSELLYTISELKQRISDSQEHICTLEKIVSTINPEVVREYERNINMLSMNCYACDSDDD